MVNQFGCEIGVVVTDLGDDGEFGSSEANRKHEDLYYVESHDYFYKFITYGTNYNEMRSSNMMISIVDNVFIMTP